MNPFARLYYTAGRHGPPVKEYHAVKQSLRRGLLAGLYSSGLLNVLARRALRDSALVLTYHRVLPRERQRDSFSSPAIVVTPETFETHMQMVRRSFNPVSVQDFFRLLELGQAFPTRTCLITFDDGWYDNHQYALPILERYEIPALLFVATDYIGSTSCFWQERLTRLLHAAWTRHDDSTFARVGTPVPQGTEAVARRRIRQTVGAAKTMPLARVRALVADVEQSLKAKGIDETARGEDRFLTWEQVAEMAASGLVTIGSHTCSHAPLTKQDASDAARELRSSRELIHRRLGATCTTFAYPNGDFDDDAAELVASAGYTLAFTTVRGHVSAGADRMRLQRVNIHQAAASTPAAFLSWTAGLL